MKRKIRILLNIKPTEIAIVKQLFLVQFFLGVATAFLFIGSLTLFLSAFSSMYLPLAYMGTAVILLIANVFYARLEKKYDPPKLLLLIILFSVGSLFFSWLGVNFFTWHWLPFFLASWNLVVYMLVGYAFWGMAAVLFNVRESKRLFTVVGAGDIPAKMLSYIAVALLVPYIGAANVLWVSIAAFFVAWYFLHKSKDLNMQVEHHESHPQLPKSNGRILNSFTNRLFDNRLIFFISLWSVVAFTIYAFIDFTFLNEIKGRYSSQQQLAAFIGIFFMIGRFLAIIFKLLLSSRLISRIGLTNALLISPVVLLLITEFILLRGGGMETHLYIFGIMVLFSEVLRSAVQDPVFFVLFQPLKPALRLKGHLIAKGYTMPFALFGAGLFLEFHLQKNGHISINLICQTLAVLLVCWIVTVYLIKKEYAATLFKAIQKGYFTGTELFLNNKQIRQLLISKTKSPNAKEVIYALDLLERSGFQKITKLWLQLLSKASAQVKIYLLDKIIKNNIIEALPFVQKLLKRTNDDKVWVSLIQTYYFLQRALSPEQQAAFSKLNIEGKKAAFLGLLSQPDGPPRYFAEEELSRLSKSLVLEDKMLAIDTITELPAGNFEILLEELLNQPSDVLFRKAIVAVAKTKTYRLLPLVFEKVGQFKLYLPLQNALVHAGDELFANNYINGTMFPAEITQCLIKVAGKIKGEHSEKYLLKLLTHNLGFMELILEALYAKRAILPSEYKKEIDAWLDKKLNQAQLKISYYQILKNQQFGLLAAALKSEIQQDLQKILMAYALVSNRLAMERIMHLYRFGDAASFSNAVEMLEVIVPKRFFLKTDAILEFLHDIKHHQTVEINQKRHNPELIITDILTVNKAGCNAWTKSVAYYIMPGLKPAALYKNLLQIIPDNNTATLVRETRNFALTQIA